MKKLVSLIVAVLTFGIISSNVFAAEIPVKEICDILNGTGIYVLSENGILYTVDNFDTPTKTKYYDDVVEIKALNPERYFYNTLLLGLRKNGEIFAHEYNQFWYRLDNINSMKLDIEQLSQVIEVEPELEYAIYINNKDEIVKKNKDDKEEILVTNVKSALVDEIELDWSDYYVTKDNILYQYIETYPNGELKRENKFIMSDVKEIKDDIILKTNGELYSRNDETINKVFSNISNLENVIEYNDWLAMLDVNGNLYYTEDYRTTNIDAKLIATNVRSIFKHYHNYGESVYFIDKNNDLFQCTNTAKRIDTQGNKIDSSIFGIYHLKTSDGYLYMNCNQKVTAIGKIKNVFSTDLGNVYVTESGDTWTDKDLENFYQIPLSSKSINLKIDNEDIVLENRMQIIDGRTMYPFRECLDIIGASVQWDGEKQIAIGEVPGIKIEFPIGKNEYYINGVKHTMDATTYVDNSIGRTYIPIRYAAEGLGYTVDWIEGDFENTISIHK